MLTARSRPADAVTDALAAFRLVRLLQEDTLLDAPRDAFLDWLHAHRLDKIEELFTCRWCLSVHVGFVVAAARRVFPRAWPFVADALAASAVTGLLGRHSSTS